MTISTKEQESEAAVEMEFSEAKMRALEEKIAHSRWVVPVLPEQELQALLTASLHLAATGEDLHNPACQKFYSESLTTSFTKILTDDAVTSWKPNIQLCVRDNCEKLVQLCALKLDDARFLHLLCLAFNPNNKFHSFNASQTYETAQCESPPPAGQGSNQEPETFARSTDRRAPRGWLVQFINVFGQAGGFIKLRQRFVEIMGYEKPMLTSPSDEIEKLAADHQENEVEKEQVIEAPPIETIESCTKTSDGDLPQTAEERVSAVWQLLRPFGLCHELLTPHTIATYMLPILECIPTLLESLSDDELKKEARVIDNKSDTVSCLIRACKCLSLKAPNSHHLIKSLEIIRLKMILRLLQMTSFNGKMSALNEINILIGNVSQQPKPEWLTPAVIINWIRENKVLDIVLRDSLHQPQYVERLEKMCRFLIKERALTTEDLDAVWRAQQGKHEVIVKNVHDLLSKLAWDFTPDQLDHLFDCFKASWASSNKKQSDKILEVMRRLAEDDKDGVMANKVLALFWDVAHTREMSTEIMDVALANLVKILDYSCSQDRDQQKILWLNKCVEELKTSPEWALPALKVMREICCLYEVGVPGQASRPHMTRQEVIERLQTRHTLVILVADSLTYYMDTVRARIEEGFEIEWEKWLPDGRYTHAAQVHERLAFLRFLLKDGQLWLCEQQAKQMWVCLAEKPATLGDREACFRWFSKLMGDEPDLDPKICLNFFTENVMTLEPGLLTHNGIRCFERFFKSVNIKEGKLKARRKSFLLIDPDLIGLEYLWRIITECDDEISARATELLRETCAGAGAGVGQQHDNFLASCCARLRQLHSLLQSQIDLTNVCSRMCRILKAVQEYINECDRRFTPERQLLPVYRAGRGKHCMLVVRFNFQTGQSQLDDLELYTHSNETLHSLRNNINKKLKCAAGTNVKVELYVNAELLDSSHDRKMLSQLPLRDKTIIVAKVCSSNGCGSSNDSSSDSSTSPSPPAPSESSLPGVILSQAPYYIPFILELEHIGVTRNHQGLAEAAHTLTQISPAHKITLERLHEALTAPDDTKLKEMFYGPPPPTVAYNVQILYNMSMPACNSRLESSCIHRLECVKRAPLLVQSLSDPGLLGACAHHTRRVCFLALVRLAKLVLNTLEHLIEILRPDCVDGVPVQNNRLEMIKEALHNNQNFSGELIDKAVAVKLATTLGDQVVNNSEESKSVSSLVSWHVPTSATVRALCELAHDAAQAHHNHVHPDDVTLVRECMEVMTICIILGNERIETLIQEEWWQKMALYLLIDCPSPQVRVSCAEQILTMLAVRGGEGARACLDALFDTVDSARLETHARHANQMLQLVCRLVALAPPSSCAEQRLRAQVEWLRSVRKNPERADDVLLEGRLNLTKELLLQSPPEIKYQYGAHPDHPDSGLIVEILTEFLWPYSWARAGEGAGRGREPPPPLCRSAASVAAACDLLLALAHGCAPNMAALCHLLAHMFYGGGRWERHDPPMMRDKWGRYEPLTEWDYAPSVGTRSAAGLVGLKNAGATCYMNSVLQQLYCISAVRDQLLVIQDAVTDPNEDFSQEETQIDSIENMPENSGDYNVTILKQVQAIFAFLRYSRLQYYVPRGLWTYFKLQGEPVNLREQQDAVELFMSLVESLDEALKTLGKEQLMTKTLGGSYSDQKICKECPHRYCKEETFSVVSLDIRNMSRLQESLEAYVRGELLEGADAYHCDKCNKKVVTVKRLCLNKLPPVLVIQLKRFEYDFEKVCAIKFNDYFEFPKELDVEPYTVWGLAKAEGEEAMWEHTRAEETNYVLSGIVVHSGQASGGHYYSYVLLRDNGTENGRWVKLDDCEVSECNMHDDEEMKTQCFGGEYMVEVYDPCLKRPSFKRQKRWWNAYMLFYTRKDTIPPFENLEQTMANMTLSETMIPRPILESVRRSNVNFLHHQDQFSIEHFNFMKKLCSMKLHLPQGQTSPVWSAEQEELSMLAVQLATKFLFQVGFRTKKTIRGPISDWYDILCQHFRYSQAIRAWFALHTIFISPVQYIQRLCDHLLLSPSTEVRVAFMKILVSLAHFSMNDPPMTAAHESHSPCTFRNLASLSDQLLVCVRELAASSTPAAFPLCASVRPRHLPLVYILFYTYAALGLHEKLQLIRLRVFELMINLCMSESLAKYPCQFPDSAKIHQVISLLTRCCDVSEQCKSAEEGGAPLPNPYLETEPGAAPPPLPEPVAAVFYTRTRAYVKKLVEEGSGVEEGVKQMQFLCWENPEWSRTLLEELLWQMGYAYCHDLRRHADALAAVLLVEDSWQPHRIHNTFGDDRGGLLETAARARQKRAYACIKLVVNVMSRAPCAVEAVHARPESRRRWRQALAWLQDQLHRQYGPSYSYGTWSPPNTSNESSGGYFLERSNSARKTLERAYQLCPEDEEDDEEEGGERGAGEPDATPAWEDDCGPSHAHREPPTVSALHETGRGSPTHPAEQDTLMHNYNKLINEYRVSPDRSPTDPHHPDTSSPT